MTTRVVGCVIAVCAALIAIVFLAGYAGVYNVAATEPHWDITQRLLHAVMRRSVEVRARDIAQIPDLSAEPLAGEGARHYAANRAPCHGAPGIDASEVGQGLMPRAPDLARAVRRWKARELFWIVKHGIKMSGMAACGRTHSDAEIWATVAFLGRLPQMSAEEYRRWVRERSRAGAAHHH